MRGPRQDNRDEPDVLEFGRGRRSLPGQQLLDRLASWWPRWGRVDAGRWRRGRQALGAVTVLAVTVTIVVVTLMPTPQPEPDSPSAGTPPSTASRTLRTIVAEAHLPGPLRDYVRPDAEGGACPAGSARYSPATAVGAVLRSLLPRFRVVDTSRTFNQTPGICSVLLRATDGRGTTMVLQVVPPAQRRGASRLVATVSNAVASRGTSTTRLVSTTTDRGWTVHVGATGPSAQPPTMQELFTVSQDPRLLW